MSSNLKKLPMHQLLKLSDELNASIKKMDENKLALDWTEVQKVLCYIIHMLELLKPIICPNQVK